MLHNNETKTTAMSLRLSPEVMAKLERLATEAERPKSYYVRKALDFYLDFLAEQDRADVQAAEASEAEQGENMTLQQMRASLGLDD